VVDVVLGALLGGSGDGLGSLTLGADEEHAAAAGDRVANGDERLMQQRNGLRQGYDMNVVSVAEEEALHLRVRAMGLVTEMDTGVQQLTHRTLRGCHDARSPFPVERPRGVIGLWKRPQPSD